MTDTRLDSAKLRTVASAAHFVASAPSEKWDRTVASQMIGEGIRKLHDCATSLRGHGKYLGHAHWSRNALMLLQQNGGTERGITKLLSHEHVVPVGVVLSILLRNDTGTSVNEIEKLIHRFSVVAIITRNEEALLTVAGLKNKMPEGWSRRDVWARYKAVGLYECIESVPA
jgi:hypothetical protein